MLSNSTVTVINEIDGVYLGTVIEGVSFVGKAERQVTDKGLISADYFVLRIPEKSGAEFKAVLEDLAEPYLQAGNGEILQTENGEPIEIFGGGKTFTLFPDKTLIAVGQLDNKLLCDIGELLRTHRVYRVMSVKDNRVGSPNMRHWRCDCK